jgi:tetraacyldisaccharide 4'-kinase
MKQTFTSRLFGTDNNPFVFLVRLALLPFSLLYYAATTVRNAVYDLGLLSPVRVDAPVVSVGNLTVGGTGKTPLVILLANRAVAAGKRVAIVARGYGAVADAHGATDEVVLMAARCPGAKLVVAPDKLLGARQAAAGGAELILVDDGMQHRRLHRDMNIVMLDARAPFGNGMVLPAGSLREPAAGQARADLVVLTHGETLTDSERVAVEASVRAFSRAVPLVWARHAPVGVRSVAGGPLQTAHSLAGRSVFLCCGIASPAGFRQTVEQLGAPVAGLLAFGDHHDFTPEDLASVRGQARDHLILCTEKDAVKLARIPGSDDIQCLVIDMQIEGRMPPIPGLDAPWSPPPVEVDEHAAHAVPDAHGAAPAQEAHAQAAHGHAAHDHTAHGHAAHDHDAASPAHGGQH